MFLLFFFFLRENFFEIDSAGWERLIISRGTFNFAERRTIDCGKKKERWSPIPRPKWDALMNFLIKSWPRRATSRYYYLSHRSIRRAAVLQDDLQITSKRFCAGRVGYIRLYRYLFRTRRDIGRLRFETFAAYSNERDTPVLDHRGPAIRTECRCHVSVNIVDREMGNISTAIVFVDDR